MRIRALSVTSLAWVLSVGALPAAEVAVTNTNDNLAGSLRQAIQDANAGDTIVFNIAPSDPGYAAVTRTWTIGLQSGTLVVTRDLQIDARGQRIVVKRTAGESAPFFGVFAILGATVSMTDLTIS